MIETHCPACGQELPTPRPRVMTCSEACHAAWIDGLVMRYGEHQRITEWGTGTVYLVPTRLILEQGIRGTDLSKFPKAPPRTR